jgi:hypothetical protein
LSANIVASLQQLRHKIAFEFRIANRQRLFRDFDFWRWVFKMSDIALPFFRNLSLLASCFPWRGGSRSSRTLEAGCDGREGVQRACARRRKQLHGRRRRVVLISRRLGSSLGVTSSKATVATKPGTAAVHRGERAISHKTIAQGMPVAAGGPWVRPAPGIPCALHSQRVPHDASPGRCHAAGMRTCVLPLFDIRIGSREAARSQWIVGLEAGT